MSIAPLTVCIIWASADSIWMPAPTFSHALAESSFSFSNASPIPVAAPYTEFSPPMTSDTPPLTSSNVTGIFTGFGR